MHLVLSSFHRLLEARCPRTTVVSSHYSKFRENCQLRLCCNCCWFFPFVARILEGRNREDIWRTEGEGEGSYRAYCHLLFAVICITIPKIKASSCFLLSFFYLVLFPYHVKCCFNSCVFMQQYIKVNKLTSLTGFSVVTGRSSHKCPTAWLFWLVLTRPESFLHLSTFRLQSKFSRQELKNWIRVRTQPYK